MWSVIHLEWLILILLGVLVLLVGCSNLPIRTPSPTTTSYPPVTLTIVPFATVSPVPQSTLPPSATQIRTVSPRFVSTISGSPPTLTSDNPSCFSSSNRGFICFGRILNISDSPSSHVTIRVRLRDANQRIVASQRFVLEQHTIPPHSFAPYRVQFSSISQYPTAQTDIISYRPDDTPATELQITGTRGAISDNGRYLITATIANTSVEDSGNWRLIASIMSQDDVIVAYRVLESSEHIAAGGTITVRLEVIPQIISDNLRHQLVIEND